MQRFIRHITLLISLLLFAPEASGQSDRAKLSVEIRRAEELYEQGRWADSRQAWMQIQGGLREQQTAERELAAYYLAVCAVELGRPDAETALKNFENHFPGSLRTNDVRFARASYYCTQGDYVKARETFDKTDYRTLSADNRSKFDIRRGYIDFAAGDYDSAYSYFERIDAKSPYADHALYYRSYIDYARGEYDKARLGFSRLCQSADYGAVAPFYLLQLEYREQNYTYVTEHGDELIATATPARQCDLLRMMAESWFHLNDYTKAYQYAASYTTCGGETSREMAYIEGFSLYRLARYEEAAEALRRAAGPADALTQNAAYHLADCYLRSGDKSSAMQAFAMATDSSLSPEIAEDALFNYAKLQYELGGGRFNEAINLLTRYRTEYPHSERGEEINTLLAAAYYNSENYDAAYEAIRTLPSPDSDLRAARQKITYYRALKQFEAGNLKEADRTLRESIEIGVSPRYNSLSGFWRGEIACAEGRYAQAAPLFESYLQRAPKSEREYALAYYNLGYCHLKRGAGAEAAMQFEKFLALYPTEDELRTDAWNRLGDGYYTNRQFDRALEAYQSAAASSASGHYYGAYQGALTLGVLGKTDAKIERLKLIVEADKGDYADDAAYELGRSYMNQKRYREAATVLEGYVERYPHAPACTAALSDLGLIYANLGEKQRSMEYYDRVVKRSPTSAEARGALQGIRELYLADGNAEGYIAYAEKSGIEGELSARTRDSLSFAAAQSLYLSHRQEDATRSLRSYIKSFPKGAYLNDALYYLSNCYRAVQESEQEFATLKQLAEAGDNQYTVEALTRLAPLAAEAQKYETAAQAYGRLSSCAPTEEERRSALEGEVDATLKSGNQALILALADRVEAFSNPSERALRKVRFAKARILEQQGEQSKAQALYDKLRTEVHSAEGAEAMYRTLLAKMERGEWKEVEKLVFTFSEMPSPNNYWLAKSFLVLGDCYLKQQDSFQARATWQSVADGYSPADDGIVAEAKERIRQLKN